MKIQNSDFIKHLGFVQLSLNEKMFKSNACQLLAEFEGMAGLGEFEKQWLEIAPNWYEGLSIFNPSTNNALEAFNALIKAMYTLRERLSLSKFFDCLKTIIVSESKLRDPDFTNAKLFAEKKEFSIKTWTEAFEFSRQNNKSSTRVLLIA